MALESLHERAEDLSEHTLDLRRATASLIEELEAVNYYQQRVDATQDAELKAILAHNRDEEIEHAAMLMEWLRRNHEKFAEEMQTYVNAKGAIHELGHGD